MVFFKYNCQGQLSPALAFSYYYLQHLTHIHNRTSLRFFPAASQLRLFMRVRFLLRRLDQNKCSVSFVQPNSLPNVPEYLF